MGILSPFQKVLVRDKKHELWRPDIFLYEKENKYICTAGYFIYCIPYEGNEKLCNSKDDNYPKFNVGDLAVFIPDKKKFTVSISEINQWGTGKHIYDVVLQEVEEDSLLKLGESALLDLCEHDENEWTKSLPSELGLYWIKEIQTGNISLHELTEIENNLEWYTFGVELTDSYSRFTVGYEFRKVSPPDFGYKYNPRISKFVKEQE